MKSLTQLIIILVAFASCSQPNGTIMPVKSTIQIAENDADENVRKEALNRAKLLKGTAQTA